MKAPDELTETFRRTINLLQNNNQETETMLLSKRKSDKLTRNFTSTDCDEEEKGEKSQKAGGEGIEGTMNVLVSEKVTSYENTAYMV